MERLGLATGALAVALLLAGIPFPSPTGAQSGADAGDPTIPFLLFTSDASMEGHPLLDGGTGTAEDPYRFEDLRIEPHFRGIVVLDTSAHVVFRNVTIVGHPVTDSQAEELIDAPEDVHYPLAQALPIEQDEDPRVIRGIQLENATNVRIEDVVMREVHHGAWLDTRSGLAATRVDITTDVFDEQPHDTTHLAGPVSLWMTETTGEAGFVARQASDLTLNDVAVTLTGTDVVHRRGDNSTATYNTIGVRAEGSTVDARGLTVEKAAFGVNAYKSEVRLEGTHITGAKGGFVMGNQTSQFEIVDSTISGNGDWDLSISEAQGTVKRSTVNTAFATADRRFPEVDGARTTELRMTNITTAPGEVFLYGGQLDGEVFQIDGLDATLSGQDDRPCEIIGGLTLTDAVVEDCTVDRNSAWGVGGGQKGGLSRNLVVQQTQLIDSTVEILPLSRWEVDENTTVLKDVVLDDTTIVRTCCFLSEAPPAASLPTEMLDLWMEDVTIRDAPNAMVLGWGWNVTMRRVEFQSSSVSFAMTHSPGGLHLDAEDVTADGQPVITEGGHISGGTWGGVLLSNDASGLTVDDGAEIGSFGVRTWGQEDLSIRNATIAADSFPIQAYMVRDVRVTDTTIVGGEGGVCLDGGKQVTFERVAMPSSGFAPGLCLDPSELTVEDVTAGGAPVLKDPPSPVTGDVGQVITSEGNLSIQDARLHGLPMGVIAENTGLTLGNVSADAGLVWTDRSPGLTVEASRTHAAPDRAERVAGAGGHDLWFAEYLSGLDPISLRAEGVPSVTIDGLDAEGTVMLDGADDEDDQREARIGDATVRDLTLPTGEIFIENLGNVTLEHVRAAGDLNTFYHHDLDLRDVFLEESKLFSVDAQNTTIRESTLEGPVDLNLLPPRSQTAAPSLSFLINATWAAANQTYDGAPKPSELGAVFDTIDQLRALYLEDAPETFTDVESALKNCEIPVFNCPAGPLYEATVAILFPPETTTYTNGHVHRSNILDTFETEGKVNATGNWWGQPSGPREEQATSEGDSLATEPAADTAFNQPPTIDVGVQGAPIANKTVVVDITAQDDHDDIEELRARVGDRLLDGPGPVTLPAPGPLTWSGVAVDGFGARGLAGGTITVLPEPVGTIETAPDQPRAGDPLYASLEGPTDAYQVAWDLGADGSTDATGAKVELAPASAGTYPLEAVFLHDGQTVERILTHVTVSEPGQSPPEVTIDADPRTGQAPLSVGVDGQGFDRDGFLDAWTLRVDGDAVATGAPPFTGETVELGHGAHTVTLAFTDEDGLTGAASVPIHVTTAPVEVTDPALSLDGTTPETWIAGERPLLSVTTSDADAATTHVGACVVGPKSDICTTRTLPTGTAELRLPALPVGPVTIEIRAWDGQGTSGETSLTMETVENTPPDLAPDVPETVQAGEPVTLAANAQDPEGRAVSTAWLTPWGAGTGDAVTVTPEGWGLQTVQATAQDPLGLTSTRSRTISVDAGLDVGAKALPVDPDGWIAVAKTNWLGGPDTPAQVDATLAFNGVPLDEASTRTGPDGIGTIHLDHPLVGLASGSYTITLEAQTPSPPDDVDPGMETATVTLEVQR